MKRLVWLASYPKSGNTWVRIVLAGCQRPGQSVDLNHIELPIASSRRWLDECLGIDTEYLTRNELLRLLPEAYATWSRDGGLHPIIKNHEMFLRLQDGTPVIPPEFSRGAVHVVRDPRAVAVSFASHFGVSTDEAIERMEDPDFCLVPSPIARQQVMQKLSTWSRHAESWMDSPIPQLQVRYEDMLHNPLLAFRQITQFCGIEIADDQLLKVIEGHTFQRLQEQESLSGFVERPIGAAAPFFRQGLAAAWKEVLTAEQVERIETCHGNVMHRLGYELTADHGDLAKLGLTSDTRSEILMSDASP